jgi:hypothetical protein
MEPGLRCGCGLQILLIPRDYRRKNLVDDFAPIRSSGVPKHRDRNIFRRNELKIRGCIIGPTLSKDTVESVEVFLDPPTETVLELFS